MKIKKLADAFEFMSVIQTIELKEKEMIELFGFVVYYIHRQRSSMNLNSKKEKILVAAIDFGTTFSGYAFSFKHEYKEDPMNIKANNSWFAGSMSLVSLKAPTCVLLSPEKQFLAFGFEAEDKYSELALDEAHQGHYFFKRFKMILAEKKLTRDIQLKDDYGKSCPAKELFAHVIRYLKNHLLETLQTRGTGLDNKDIHWVLTVPAIWIFACAGIESEQLTICLEPEAASLYCQMLPMSRLQGPDANVALKGNLVGGPALKEFQDANKADDLDLHRELETKKRTISPKGTGKVTVKVPVSLVQTFERQTQEKIKDVIQQGSYVGKMNWVGDKLRMETDVFREMFRECIDSLIDHIRDLLKCKELQGLNTLIMVGGFSESDIMQDAFRQAFPDKKIIVPEESGLAVLKGAVLFGHKPQTITERISKYTYGINISPPYVPGEHSPLRKVTIDGVDRVKDVFKKYIEVDQRVKVGEAVTGRHVTIKRNQKEMLLKIFASDQKNPGYVTDDTCEYLGKVVVKLPESEEKLKVEVKMIFGETELMVEAKEQSTGPGFEKKRVKIFGMKYHLKFQICISHFTVHSDFGIQEKQRILSHLKLVDFDKYLTLKVNSVKE
ncbi:hypothetical protein KUTeg_025016 [Tegillarca granosa]|uniref:Uncharacterized protein n=1 Tax=Tegillarca granosa TaxID=220873 RepID=A0ABQ9E4M0_TEGGR|nr:hypothetical protein KUTeg_025016 [Tegillarca granosa]